MLRLIGIGALGNMLNPAALHLRGEETPAKFIRIYDRNPQNESRKQRRDQWLAHGAEIVSDYRALLQKKDFEGIFICVGKNGDDLPIIKTILRLLRQYFHDEKKPFIVHLSTLSVEFVAGAHEACQKWGVRYVNYPLTGGEKGAKLANMLILASGDEALFKQLKPTLTKLGQPRYLGQDVTNGAKVKLIGHLLVFNGLIGVSSAVALQTKALPLKVEEQVELFDYLNQGGGGTKQWDVALKQAVSNQIWDSGFLLPHAAIDAIYTVDLLIKEKMPSFSLIPILYICAAFSFILQKQENAKLATQLVFKYILEKQQEMEAYISNLQDFDTQIFLEKVIHSFPKELQEKIHLHIAPDNFLENE